MCGLRFDDDVESGDDFATELREPIGGEEADGVVVEGLRDGLIEWSGAHDGVGGEFGVAFVAEAEGTEVA